MLFTMTILLAQIFAEDIPRSTATRNLLSSTSITYPDQLHIFKVKVLNCKVYAFFGRTRRSTKSAKICRNIITDFKKIFNNDFEALENKCRRVRFNSSTPCFPFFIHNL